MHLASWLLPSFSHMFPFYAMTHADHTLQPLNGSSNYVLHMPLPSPVAQVSR